jgi:hypothetical protein
MEIETNDGRTFRHFQPTRKGDPEMPLTDDELDDKFLELATPVIGQAGAHALLAQLWDTEILVTVEYDVSEHTQRVPEDLIAE